MAKPAPLLTQGVPPGVPTLEAMVKAYLKERYHKPGNVYLGIPHRLDRPVSGVVVFARNTKAARRLAEQFRSGRSARSTGPSWRRTPTAKLPPEEGVWEDWLLKMKEEARTERVAAETPGARRAVLRYRRLSTSGGRGVAGDRAGDGTDAPDPRAGGTARLAGARRCPVRGALPLVPRRSCRATASSPCTRAA